MWFSRKQVKVGVTGKGEGAAGAPLAGAVPLSAQVTTKSRGDAAESAALAHLSRAGLQLVERNYRTPGRGGGEIDLVMRAADGTLVFVEVRQRSGDSHGGAAASIGAVKQQRIIFAAQHFLMRFASAPPCRFDVVLVQGGAMAGAAPSIEWLQAAFDAS